MVPIAVELLRAGEVAFRQPMEGDRLSLGRAPDNSVVLADEGISRHHGVIFWMDGLLWVRDLGSRNGTFLNGLPLDGAQPVEDGDRLRLGDALEIRVVGAPSVGERRAEVGALLIEDEASGVRRVVPRPPADAAAEPPILRLPGLSDLGSSASFLPTLLQDGAAMSDSSLNCPSPARPLRARYGPATVQSGGLHALVAPRTLAARPGPGPGLWARGREPAPGR